MTRPKQTSSGKTRRMGTFATASLKTYPAGLCRTLAEAWGQSFLRQAASDTDTAPPEPYATIFDVLHSVMDGGQADHGPDFCPRTLPRLQVARTLPRLQVARFLLYQICRCSPSL